MGDNMKKIYYFLIQCLLCVVLFLFLAILCKGNSDYKSVIQDKLYHDNFEFSYFKGIYNKYLGGVFPLWNVSELETSSVFYEKLIYSDISSYEDGAILSVSNNYLVPSMDDGIVVYVGKKDNYNNVVIVKNQDGIDVWYGNICNTLVKLYDNIESGTYLGESCDSTIYLVYKNGDEYLDYHKYLS
jgi:stage IV sporulation protein FA